MFYNDKSRTKSTIIGILRNGNHSDLKSISVEGFNYNFTNTCAFESLFHVICSSFIESNEYSKLIQQERVHIFFELVNDALKDGINTQTYRKRAVILKEVMSELQSWSEHPSGLRHLDCSSTAEYIIQKVFTNYPSFTTIEKCCNCSYTKKEKHTTITVNLPTDDFDFLNDALLSYFKENTKECFKCNNGNTEQSYDFGSQLFIEPTYYIQAEKITIDISSVLFKIPKTLKIREKVYHVRGVIDFIPPVSKNIQAIGHYIAYCWKGTTNKWEKYDDLSSSVRVIRSNSVAKNCQILVYTL